MKPACCGRDLVVAQELRNCVTNETVANRHVIAAASPDARVLVAPPAGSCSRRSQGAIPEYNVMSDEARSRARRRHISVFCCAFLCAGFALCINVLASDAGGSEGWYTADQAAHGHVTFNSFCAECHRPDLKGALGPALVGDAFLSQWINKPLGNLYEFEHTKMPANNPGSVPDEKLWNITAYILQKNGFPVGSTPLSAQSAARALATAQPLAAK
jgi:S-disulfanyl-L-cysteine oxidoreductase SoxD